MFVIFTCEYEGEPIKNSWKKSCSTVFPILSIWRFFQAISRDRIGTISNSFELLCMSSLPVNIIWLWFDLMLYVPVNSYGHVGTYKKIKR